ncbi:MAG TPA: cytochrome C biogenesis protein [Bacteroides graminisolvens]|uniref:Cytochrome C biogenesis protein n=1 Tax=Bacteroides graminisolvens TaxID=477666 RepID=A0A3D2SH21_9BACE|nr:cytochrome C biogenesis protein [Bacteroides graminisolvens]
MEFLQSLLDNSNLPVLTAFILGLLTAVSPCPLATNITAIGFISKDIQSRNRIFWSGILYTLGRVISYTILGFILIPILREGASMFAIQKAISKYGDVFIAPALILIGLFMLLGNRLNLPKFGFSAGDKTQALKGSWGSLLLGTLFALAFCPTSGVFYFGMLMPMAAAETGGYLLPGVFSLGNRLPVIFLGGGTGLKNSRLGQVFQPEKGFLKGV